MGTKLQKFIDENRAALEQAIRGAMGRPNHKLDDDDIEEWINNDEGLYNWASSEGALSDDDDAEDDDSEAEEDAIA